MTEKQKTSITLLTAFGIPVITALVALGIYMKSIRDSEGCIERVTTQVNAHETRITVLEKTLPTMASDVKEIKEEVKQLNRELLRQARNRGDQ